MKSVDRLDTGVPSFSLMSVKARLVAGQPQPPAKSLGTVSFARVVGRKLQLLSRFGLPSREVLRNAFLISVTYPYARINKIETVT